MPSKTNKTTYLKVEDILIIHVAILDETGGSDGVRDLGRLEAAIAHPQQVVYGKEIREDIFSKAAAYGFDIIKYHPFVDGNKRTAMTTMAVFLSLNSYTLSVEKGAIEKMAVDIVEKNMSIEDISTWLKNNSKYSH